MKVFELHPGMKFENPIIGTAVFIAQCPHPYYQGLQLVIWRLERDNTISLDALSAAQEVGEPLVQPREEWMRQVQQAIGIAGER